MHWHINISVLLCIPYQWVSDWTYTKPHPFNRFMWCWSTLVKTANPFFVVVGLTWNDLFKGNQIMKQKFKKQTHTIDSRCPKIIFKQFNMPLDDFWCIRGNHTYHCAVRNTFLVIFYTIYEILRFELRLFFIECLPDGCSMKPVIVLDHLCNCEKLHFICIFTLIDVWCKKTKATMLCHCLPEAMFIKQTLVLCIFWRALNQISHFLVFPIHFG